MLSLAAVLFVIAVHIRDWKRSGLRFFDHFVVWGTRLYVGLWHRWSSNRPAPFPLERGALIISNHTCSSDPMLIMAGCRAPIGFVVAQEHFAINPAFRFILEYIGSVPVQRGGCDPAAIRGVMRKLAQGRALCIFPEGGLSGVAMGRMRRGKPGMAYIALKCGVPVYPVYIDGGPHTNDLLRAWIVPTPKRARVIYGPPIDLSRYAAAPVTRQTIEEVTVLLMQSIRALAPRRNAPIPHSRPQPRAAPPRSPRAASPSP